MVREAPLSTFETSEPKLVVVEELHEVQKPMGLAGPISLADC